MIFVSKLSCFLPSRGRHFGSNIAEKPVQVEDNKSESESWIHLRKFCLFVLPFEIGFKYVLSVKGADTGPKFDKWAPPPANPCCLSVKVVHNAVASCSRRCG